MGSRTAGMAGSAGADGGALAAPVQPPEPCPTAVRAPRPASTIVARRATSAIALSVRLAGTAGMPVMARTATHGQPTRPRRLAGGMPDPRAVGGAPDGPPPPGRGGGAPGRLWG